jgi:predicted small secreted protein
VILAVIIAVVVVSLALAWRNSRRGAGITRLEAFGKAVVHTYRHFNPPPPPIIGP